MMLSFSGPASFSPCLPPVPVRPDPMHWKAILREVAAKHGMSVEAMLVRSRKPAVSHPRQEAMWRMKRETTMSYPAIARRLRMKDHTTAIHGVKAHQERLDKGLVG